MNCRFSISDYHAIRKADVALDGITVIAGINGSGKSTLSKWLYYLINGMNDFERVQKHSFLRQIALEMRHASFFFRGSNVVTKYGQYLDRLFGLEKENDMFEKELDDLYASFVLQLEQDLNQVLVGADENVLRRASVFFDVDLEPGRDASSFISDYIARCNGMYESGFDNYVATVSACGRKALEEAIQDEYSEHDPMPLACTFTEADIPLLHEDSFVQPLMITKAIYIDSPMALSAQADPDDSSIWGHFRKLLEQPASDESVDTAYLQTKLSETMSGTVRMVKDDLDFSQELHFVAKDGLDIRIADAATGVKSFAYLLRLLQNNHITKNTVLIIDEPEAHLHPQWVVEFARMLVLVNKVIGARIMVASHNPDMVAALHDFAEVYGRQPATNFYLAEADSSNKYTYRHLGFEIGPIFESFNVSLDLIRKA